MDNKEIQNQIQEIVRDVLDNDSIILQPMTTAIQIKGWDSLAHISIITQVEIVFDIHFTLKEMAGFSNVKDIVEAIRAHQK